METTRHFVATVYVVSDGAVALHEHSKLDMWLPAGGHIDRDELPHEAALRETREELGLDVELIAPQQDIESETVRSIPQPQHFLLEDINVNAEGEVGHQHIDFIFYGRADGRDITPGPGEQPADDWEWFSVADLQDRREELPADVVEVGQQAIKSVREA
ncbi:ADP-ribose pyrophosphatase YjhB, NUDIX family [Haloarcula vallismortis]|uniref:Mut/nudix family protein n=2 Tax=Haloarcula vallismortis TaxID=28442 RepID=M0JM48_HALVA|nr:NUDIX hydrolase [Haloarcula vallismortis]EMA09039.1 Mut/nudix family protein [Haloarcula vallismortis ATCC 29715]SDX09997.1 ADP-ribose pyrophosphatase YjhB, NUDIX family [Haloarcula vallismortis]